jgi:maltose alpha-D-glucosyltransferase/alpha-amylase
MNVLPEIPASADAVQLDWYKDAVVYQIHVKSFMDSNDDGIGDFNGLTSKLDYLQDLGVTALWLLPFYPSPGRDDGYDIADYRTINSDFGDMRDFRRFLTEARRRGLKIITELVINHTSDKHPWFERARTSPPDSSARNWYVWSDTDQRYLGTRIIFSDTEKSNWTWDPVAGAYYWHRFFAHQPDLNFDNPEVFRALVQIMRRWLNVGVDGFRLDAIPYLCEREGTSNENLPETHDIIKRLRAEIDKHSPGTMLLAEANQWPEDVSAYFGSGDECHMAYHFPLMPRIYMSIAQEDRFPITDIMRQTPDIPANCQWALFLRNHDELTLEMVTDSERDYLWSTYATDPRARINLGIRRRLAPLMESDRRKIELMNALLFSLPGTPIIYYGDEIGMGDNIYLGDRNGVRTPMQWTPDRNGGFSRCDPAKLYLPPIMDPVYGYQAINVEAQSRSLSSLLNWMKRMISVRKTSQVFGRGSLSFANPSNRAVLAYIREYNGEVILCVANLSRSAQSAEIDLSAWKGREPTEMLGRKRFRKIDDTPFVVTLMPYGFFWFHLAEETQSKVENSAFPPEWITLVISEVWVRDGRSRQMFERDVLPGYLTTRRWFSQKGAGPVTIKVGSVELLPLHDPEAAFVVVNATTANDTARYFLPLAVRWGGLERHTDVPRSNLLARVRRTHREGLLCDATAELPVVSWLVSQVHDAVVMPAVNGTIEFIPSKKFAEGPLPAIEAVHPIEGEQSNSTVNIDSKFVIKFRRKLSPGVSPEIEVGAFLTDIADFRNAPALLGSVELVEDGDRTDVAVLHEFIGNQGDAWKYTVAYLGRVLDEERMVTTPEAREGERHVSYLNFIRQVGRRLGELHLAFAGHPDVAGFETEPVTAEDVVRWTEALRHSTEHILERVQAERSRLDTRAEALAERLFGARDKLFDNISAILTRVSDVKKIRHHGDLHLGQILVAKDDVFIVDFEGEPQRTKDERRRKAPSARDAAGIIRSLDYAATTALQGIATASPEEMMRCVQALDQWREDAIEAFLASLREASAGAGLWPEDMAASNELLRLFVAEKAVYEVGYELSNRPDWVAVPLAGIARALLGEEVVFV